MRHRRSWYATAAILAGGTLFVKAAEQKAAPPPPAQGQVRPYLMVIEMYRFDTLKVGGTLFGEGSFGDAVFGSGTSSGETTFGKGTVVVPGHAEKSPDDARQPRYSMIFSEADITAGGVRFRAREDGWTWNGKSEPPPGISVEKIASPRIVAAAGQPFELFIGSEVPIQFFEKRPDGLFELKDLKEWTGLKIQATIDSGTGDTVMVKELTVAVRTVGKRMPLEGVSLDVGPPVVAARELVTTLACELDRNYGVLFESEGRGMLLLKIRVSQPPPVGTAVPAEPKDR